MGFETEEAAVCSSNPPFHPSRAQSWIGWQRKKGRTGIPACQMGSEKRVGQAFLPVRWAAKKG